MEYWNNTDLSEGIIQDMDEWSSLPERLAIEKSKGPGSDTSGRNDESEEPASTPWSDEVCGRILERDLTKKEKRCRSCIHWEDGRCRDYEVEQLNHGRPIKSCSNHYPITKYNSQYEIERRPRRQHFY